MLDFHPAIERTNRYRPSDLTPSIDLAVALQTTLKPKELDIIARTAAGYSLAEIAAHYGVTRERIRQIKHRAATRALDGGCFGPPGTRPWA